MAEPSRIPMRWVARIPQQSEVNPDPAARGPRELGAPLVPYEAALLVKEGCEAGAGGALAWGAIHGSDLPNRWVFGAVDSTADWRTADEGEGTFAFTLRWVATTENARQAFRVRSVVAARNRAGTGEWDEAELPAWRTARADDGISLPKPFGFRTGAIFHFLKGQAGP